MSIATRAAQDRPVRTLVVGSGPIGSYLAARLQLSGPPWWCTARGRVSSSWRGKAA